MALDATANVTANVQTIVTDMHLFRSPQAGVTVTLTHTNLGSNEVKDVTYNVPRDPSNPGTELSDFLTAIGAPRSGETGTVARRMNFRILGALFDAGQLPGFTLTP